MHRRRNQKAKSPKRIAMRFTWAWEWCERAADTKLWHGLLPCDINILNILNFSSGISIDANILSLSLATAIWKMVITCVENGLWLDWNMKWNFGTTQMKSSNTTNIRSDEYLDISAYPHARMHITNTYDERWTIWSDEFIKNRSHSHTNGNASRKWFRFRQPLRHRALITTKMIAFAILNVPKNCPTMRTVPLCGIRFTWRRNKRRHRVKRERMKWYYSTSKRTHSRRDKWGTRTHTAHDLPSLRHSCQ